MSEQGARCPITAVCLDLDGTLVAFDGDFGAWTDGLRIDLGLLHCDANQFGERLSGALRRDGPVTLASALEETLGAMGLARPPDLGDAAARAVARYAAAVRFLPDALRALDAIRERALPVAIVSNGPEDMQRAVLVALDLADRFAAIVISGDPSVGARKPAARPFALAVAALGRPAAEVLMVGDDVEADVRGALACGLQVVRVGSGGPGFEAVPHLAALDGWLHARIG